jgi:hypothetical protein
VDRRLATYQPIETPPDVSAEMERIVKSGFESQIELPFVPPAEAPTITAGGGGRRRNRRRG